MSERVINLRKLGVGTTAATLIMGVMVALSKNGGNKSNFFTIPCQRTDNPHYGQSDVCVIDNLAHNINLTKNMETEFSTSWSPDGSQFAYSMTDAQLRAWIYRRDLDGNISRVTGEEFMFASEPEWIKAGEYKGKILFTGILKGQDSYSDIFMIDEDGKNPIRLTYSRLGQQVNTPVISPDGNKIIFSMYDSNFPNDRQLMLMDADGSNLGYLTEFSGEQFDAAFSPEGERIAFINSYQSGKGYKSILWVVNIQNGEMISVKNVSAYHPSWSPDGKQITFSGMDSNNNGGIFMVNSNGTNLKKIPDTSFEDSKPNWAADGKIYFHSTKDQSKYAIYAMNPDGSNREFIAYTGYSQDNSMTPDLIWYPQK